MQNFEVEPDTYSMQLLMTFGIINSNSTAEEKAESIWNAYDHDFNDSLPSGAIKTILEDIFECSIQFVDTLFKGGADDRTADYLNNLYKRRKNFFQQLESQFQDSIFGRNDVGKEAFIGKVMFEDSLKAFFEPMHLRSRVEMTHYNPENLAPKGAFAALLTKVQPDQTGLDTST